MTYTIQNGDALLASSSAHIGAVPQNVTVKAEVTEQLGLGCHALSLRASNGLTSPEVLGELQGCVLKPVEGLQASVMSEGEECPNTSDLIIGVSLENGNPVQLVFTMTGDNDTFSETRDMLNGSLATYTFSSPIEGTHVVL